MAKRKPTRTVAELEEEMGFQLRHLTETPTGRLFSSLRPVSSDLGERTEKEHEEFVRRKCVKESGSIALKQGQSETVVYHDNSVILSHDHGPGFYSFPLDIHYGFGLNLTFLFSEFEASHVLSTAKLHKLMAATRSPTPTPVPAFLGLLPLEVRQAIYNLALPQGEWRMIDDEDFERDNFPRGIGDPSGFYYPLSKALSVLRVNKQIRREALPFAYRRTIFCLDNLESAIKFLIAVGQVGRENIETLRLAWESTSESTNSWDVSSDQGPGGLPGRLPSGSTSTCIQLLKQCKRLRHLSLQFDSDLIQEIGHHAFRADAGIQDLCTLQGLKRVEIQDWGMIPLESDLAKWLKEQMEGARREDERRDEDTYGPNISI
ncbi:hypothetical protein GGTG_09972 [Gaeumannomyces tritici R3-111a-1]|uniref:Uncharacterized protein n=1 Tax=Gaeumannomyces tritici (strain R3-111a-1) TaxID=644352 RepID=J3P8Y7_GAET3|nr:hypothetical protein GGTG_09972 [Gaeumannomyces tritici R3-111a-1]EJT73122.1 hypothetical protein GGTG_09972 [Gaeumannomyces tritici R3-111a-1]